MNSKFSTAWLATARTQVCILEIDEYRSIGASIYCIEYCTYEY